MRLGNRNQPVQAFASDRSDHPFARIALAIGLRGGDFRTFSPSRSIDSSRLFAKMLSGSWIR